MTGLRWTFIAAAIALAFALLFLSQCQRARRAGAEASLSAQTAKAVGESGADAVGAVGAVSVRNSDGDRIGRENYEAIQSAAGADQLVPHAVDDAGRRGLCRRAAYADNVLCKDFLK
ncbi:hypothetical protein [Novosphingobium sp.]|uniref:hypothetical protein n=1 Tax=Novosphingobium sp. TaxID=1874826 RepID=UPI0038BA0F4A